jgi:tRNA(Ile)-lysidine synthase
MALEPIRIPHHRLVRAVAGALRGRCGVPVGARLLVAVSGGADSVALLRILHALAPRRSWQLALTVGHVQHHLRPETQAEADARFTAALAEDLKLPLLRADLDPAAPRCATFNPEAWARRERYRALRLMAHSAAAPWVVTAHHADDQLETLLMRVLRGSSVRGLAGMPWRRPLARDAAEEPVYLIRPMLGADRALVRSFLHDIGQTWREDASNRDRSRLRAALRLEVVPKLTALRPDAPARAVRLGDHLRQVGRLLDAAVASAADRVTRQPGRDGAFGWAALDRTEARTLPPVVLAGLLRRLLRHAGVPRDRLGQRKLGPLLRAIRDRAGGQRVFDLGSGIRASVGKDRVRIVGPPAAQ